MILLLVCFGLGALGGFLFAVMGEPSAELRSYLREYFDLAAHGGLDISLLSVLWDFFRWPLAVVAFAFTSLGVGVIPALLLIRGFLLSYSAASFGVLLGTEGAAAAAAVFGVTALLGVPSLFVFGCESLRSAFLCLPGSPGSRGQLRPTVLLPGIGALAVAAALQWTVTPALMSAVCARFFA